MSLCKWLSVGGIVLLGLMVAACSAAAQEKQQSELDDTNVATKTLAAFRALQAKCASFSFELADPAVRDAVLTRLRQDPSELPKTMPSAQQLRENLVGDFESQWNDLITDVTSGLDADGKLTLAERLQELIEKQPRVKNETLAKYQRILAEDLPRALQRVESKLIEEQTDALLKTLEDVVNSGLPNQDLIYRAADDGVAHALNRVTAAVLQRTSEDMRAVLLVKAHGALSAEGSKIVEDGSRQLDEQLSVFADKSTAVSKAGIQQELQEKINSCAQRQSDQRGEAPLRPSYGVFSRAHDAVPGEALRQFQQRVAATAIQVRLDVVNLKLGLDDADRNALRQLLNDEPVQHHDPDDSRQIARPRIQELVASKRAWITDSLVAALAKSTHKADAEYSQDEFLREVDQVLDSPNCQAGEVWSDLQRKLQQRFEKSVLPKVRQEIAENQSAQFAPRLMNGTWWPTEQDLQNNPPALDEKELVRLPFWSKPAPLRSAVLQETWQLWENRAESALSVCSDARVGQLRIVDSLKNRMLSRIRIEPRRGQAEWVEIYAAEVRTAWGKERSVAGQRYRQLFASTREQIEGIIAQLLPQAEELEPKEKQEMPSRNDEPDVPTPDTPQAKSETSTASDQQMSGGANGGDAGAESDGDAVEPEKTGGAEEAQPGGDQEGGPGEEGQQTDESEVAELEGPAGSDEETAKDGDELELPRRGGILVITTDLEPLEPLATKMAETSWMDRFYRVGFWVLLLILLILACCWYWNVRTLKRLIASQRGPAV